MRFTNKIKTMEELIKLCKHEDIKFESSFLYNHPYKYSGKEELRKLFWLTELKQFIYNKFNVYVSIDHEPSGFYFSFTLISAPLISKLHYDTEILALQKGLEYFLNCYIDSKND